MNDPTALRAALNPLRFGIAVFIVCIGLSLSSRDGIAREIGPLIFEAWAVYMLILVTRSTERELERRSGPPTTPGSAVSRLIPPALAMIGLMLVALVAIARSQHWDAAALLTGAGAWVLVLFAIPGSAWLIANQRPS